MGKGDCVVHLHTLALQAIRQPTPLEGFLGDGKYPRAPGGLAVATLPLQNGPSSIHAGPNRQHSFIPPGEMVLQFIGRGGILAVSSCKAVITNGKRARNKAKQHPAVIPGFKNVIAMQLEATVPVL